MILVDSSVWIDFFRGADGAAVQQLSEWLQDSSSPLAVADLVLFEVLRGFREHKHHQQAQALLLQLPCVELGGVDNALAAARHYRALRAKGHTVSSPVDVLQASYCIQNQCMLLHSDRDFNALETIRGLRVWKPLH